MSEAQIIQIEKKNCIDSLDRLIECQGKLNTKILEGCRIKLGQFDLESKRVSEDEAKKLIGRD